MTAKPHNFDWMHEAIYEPPALPDYGRTRAPMTLFVFALLGVLAAIVGCLAALRH